MQDGTPTGRSTLNAIDPLATRQEKTLLGVTLETRTTEFPFKPMEEHNWWLTTALSTACPRDDGRSSFLVTDQCADAQLSV